MTSGAKRSVAVAAAMIVGGTLMIWAGVHNARERRLDMQRIQSQPSGKAASMPEAGAADDKAGSSGLTPRLLGKSAPAFTLVDLNGNKVSLSDFRGKPVLINFWATWCGPCKIEMPWFEEFHKKYASQGLIILGVAADDAGKSVIAATAQRLGVTYPILLKDDKVEEAFGGINYLPQSFYVDKTGKVMLETAGLNDNSGGKDEIEANLKKLIATGGQ